MDYLNSISNQTGLSHFEYKDCMKAICLCFTKLLTTFETLESREIVGNLRNPPNLYPC